MGMSAPLYYTADMVRAMPDDGNRYEVVYGELLVTPAPRLWHQVLVKRLSRALDACLERHPIGELLISRRTSPGAPTCWSSRMFSSSLQTRPGP